MDVVIVFFRNRKARPKRNQVYPELAVVSSLFFDKVTFVNARPSDATLLFKQEFFDDMFKVGNRFAVTVEADSVATFKPIKTTLEASKYKIKFADPNENPIGGRRKLRMMMARRSAGGLKLRAQVGDDPQIIIG